ncbi:MAG TPA: hypothetical protein VMH04_15705 [Candidatus Solibacter sp.]|nr:hypothetical protein [Candidatus Solibacter sp.]
MRSAVVLVLLVASLGLASAQDTNFSTGPQYLITTDSPLFLRSIATPTLSFEPPMAPPAPITPGPGTELPTSAVPAPIQSQPDLARVYWGGQDTSVVEISSEEPVLPLPASIFNPGVGSVVESRSLSAEGYGVTVGEASAYWKAHKPHATHIYTNQDVEKLHGE